MNNEELVKLYQEGNNKALEELINNNNGILKKIANKYRAIAYKRLIEFDELFNSGVIGLINAAEKYDSDNENKANFITYATHYINRYIYFCVNGKSIKDIENSKLYDSITSLNNPMRTDESEDIEVMNLIEDPNVNIHEEAEKNIEYEWLMKLVNTLPDKDRNIVLMRYGFVGNKEITLEKISKMYGITRERVRQIESRAVRNLRHNPEVLKIKFTELKENLLKFDPERAVINMERTLEYIRDVMSCMNIYEEEKVIKELEPYGDYKEFINKYIYRSRFF